MLRELRIGAMARANGFTLHRVDQRFNLRHMATRRFAMHTYTTLSEVEAFLAEQRDMQSLQPRPTFESERLTRD